MITHHVTAARRMIVEALECSSNQTAKWRRDAACQLPWLLLEAKMGFEMISRILIAIDQDCHLGISGGHPGSGCC